MGRGSLPSIPQEGKWDGPTPAHRIGSDERMNRRMGRQFMDVNPDRKHILLLAEGAVLC